MFGGFMASVLKKLLGIGASAALFASFAHAEHKARSQQILEPEFSFFTSQFSSDNLNPDFVASTFVGMDAKFSKKDVCDDYELALHLLALIQPPSGHRGNNVSLREFSKDLAQCPGTFSGVARILASKFAKIKDFHTSYATGNAVVDQRYFPVVVGCEGADYCKNVLGSRLVPVYSNVAREFYFSLADDSDRTLIFKLNTMNGKTPNDLFQDLVNSELASANGTGGNYTRGVAFVLGRTMIDGRDRPNFFISAKDLVSKGEVTLQTSFVVAPRWEVTAQQKNFLTAFAKDIDTDDVCKAVSFYPNNEKPYKDGVIGACVTNDNRTLVWLKTMVPNETDSVVEFLARFLRENRSATQKPVILDLRSNGGGSPFLAAELACAFGDNISRNRVKNRFLNPSLWPERFELSSGTVVGAEQLKKMIEESNSDLISVVPGWTVSSLSPTVSRRDRKIGFLERMEATQSDCVKQALPEFDGVKWVLVTNGNEFSATENFLSFVEKSDAKFKHVGTTSWGGTGAPFVIRLPKTGMRLRISQARHIDARADNADAAFVIESRGVKPDNFVLREMPDEFEDHVNDVMKTETHPNFLPNIFRWALGVRM
jgi:hypothetical protein